MQKQTTTTTDVGLICRSFFLRTEIFLSLGTSSPPTHHINKRKRSNAALFLVSASSSSSSSSSSLDGALFVFSFSASGIIIEEMCSGSNGCFVEGSN